MQVPALRPRLRLLAAVRPQAALPRSTREWREALSASEDGYEVKVLVTG